MHELSLYGQIRKDDHHRMLQQLAGFTRMQPQDAKEIHLVFKARQPPGLDLVQSIGASNLASQQQQEIQRVKNMLNAGIYHVRLIGAVQGSKKIKGAENGDVVMQDNDPIAKSDNTTVSWTLEFKDTPEAGKQTVSSRLLSRTPMEGTNLVQFLDGFGFEYTSRYMVVGSRFYENDTTIFVHKVLRLPRVAAEEAISDKAYNTNISDLPDLDGSGSFIVQASIDMVDGNNSELKDRATRQLLGIKEALKQAVDLTPGDRLALDTRLPANSRRT
ncbi:Mediator of RNA polymerase II transcription subunit 18 [Cladophialophora chaetospira]|uniref:Mediator of RNA polymerase II transcription subunit 18 n=1 Tax=Cladophialophora chaetospira TaxID=386627 RepID=A0AA38X7B2_9EURO|nr:Mediator of RNA polymerase II transcription subunit 18 [Cladophialophora chaetospira]